ncbi:MAG: hypothetical protein IKB42_05260 [Clostridia bacterium]|nr:hypothetical protein [Clostridia bacterium]
MSTFENFEMVDNQIVNNKWIEWNHFGIPNEAGFLRETIRILMLVLGHCLICTKLDGCYFVERKMPEQPQHERCDCTKLNKSQTQVKDVSNSECDIRKFTDYIFRGTGGKKDLFESWGYTLKDSQILQKEFEKQAREQYIKGNYELKGLDYNGQRIAIPINLKGNIFYSGWMVYPNGKLKNTTPFGGWVK